MNTNTVIISAILFIISLFIGYLAEKRIKNKPTKNELDDNIIEEDLHIVGDFGSFEDETINNMF